MKPTSKDLKSQAEKEKVDKLIGRYETMKGLRSTWEAHWQDCADYVIPRKNEISRHSMPGNKRQAQIFDSTAAQAAELLAGALHGMMTNPSAIWFDYTAGEVLDKQDAVRAWLQEAGQITHRILNNSNFQTEVHELYIDQTWAGTSCMSIEEDDEYVVRFGTRHIAEIYIQESNRGIIDTVFRAYKWSAKQIVQEYGYDNVGPDVQKLYQDNPQKELNLLAAVYPRDESEKIAKMGVKSYPFASDVLIVEHKKLLSESGFKEFPYVVPRWTKSSGEVYGRSPTMKCLPDIMMIQEMMKTVLRAAQKTVDPPLMAPDDGFLMPYTTKPGGFNYYRAGTTDKIEPLMVHAQIDFGYQVMEDVRKRIREAFYVDQLQLAQGPQMTATEVLQRTEEKLKLMGPMLGRQQSEFLAPMIDRMFAIMLRKNIFPPMPTALSGRTIHVRYSSQIAKAQRASELNNITRGIQAIAPMVQTDPSTMDIFNPDAFARYIANMIGIPQEILRNKEDIAKIRKAKADAAAKQQQQQDEQHQADIVSKMGPTAVQAQQAQTQQGVV